ncbi:TPA: integrase core domain-containing protein [Providencia rettgeri]
MCRGHDEKARFAETQIVNMLKLADSGMKMEDICRQKGSSNATYYNWKERLKAERGLPKQILVDNGPELISVSLLNYCEDNQILLCHIQPGKPQKNRFIERFNGSFRREFLNAYLFESLSQVRELAWFWLQGYNHNRTHESLNHLPPEAYRKQLKNAKLVCLN